MLRIKLQGPTRVVGPEREWSASQLGGVKQRQILELLALDVGEPVPKELLAERLWDGEPPRGYLATVESYVCVLRRRLGLHRGPGSALVTTTRGYLLDPDEVSVDLHRTRAVLASRLPAEILDLIDTEPGQLLASEPYAPWAEAQRDLLCEQLACACAEASYLALEGGYTAPALRLARASVQQSYFSEFARRALMQALWASGERTQALLAYADLRRHMKEDLGIEPGAESRDLYVSMLREDDTRPQHDDDRIELATLLVLLRQVLDVTSPVDVPASSELVRVIDDVMSAPGLSLSTDVPRPLTA